MHEENIANYWRESTQSELVRQSIGIRSKKHMDEYQNLKGIWDACMMIRTA